MLMLAMLCSLVALLYMHFQRYTLYPTVTVVKAHMSESVPFPAVTVCNLNQFHFARIPNDPRLRQLLYRLSDFAYIKDFLLRNRNAAYGGGTTEETVKVESGEELRGFALNAAHTLRETFQ